MAVNLDFHLEKSFSTENHCKTYARINVLVLYRFNFIAEVVEETAPALVYIQVIFSQFFYINYSLLLVKIAH